MQGCGERSITKKIKKKFLIPPLGFSLAAEREDVLLDVSQHSQESGSKQSGDVLPALF